MIRKVWAHFKIILTKTATAKQADSAMRAERFARAILAIFRRTAATKTNQRTRVYRKKTPNAKRKPTSKTSARVRARIAPHSAGLKRIGEVRTDRERETREATQNLRETAAPRR